MPTIVWLQLIELDQEDLIMFDPRGLFFDKAQSKSGIWKLRDNATLGKLTVIDKLDRRLVPKMIISEKKWKIQ